MTQKGSRNCRANWIHLMHFLKNCCMISAGDAVYWKCMSSSSEEIFGLSLEKSLCANCSKYQIKNFAWSAVEVITKTPNQRAKEQAFLSYLPVYRCENGFHEKLALSKKLLCYWYVCSQSLKILCGLLFSQTVWPPDFNSRFYERQINVTIGKPLIVDGSHNE